MTFKIGHIYKDSANNTYQFLRRDGDFGIFKFNLVERRYKIIKYCGVESIIQFGKVIVKCADIKPTNDPEFDTPKEPKIIKLNSTQRYINVFEKNITAKCSSH